MNANQCIVLRRASGASQQLKRELRRLQKTFLACKKCTLHDECELSQRIQEWVAQAAQQVLDEFGS